jgi:acyl-CoA synthetase (AMP-forming)/AMP-acid ligase II
MFGDSDAVVADDTSYTYAELLRAVAGWREFLDTHRVGPGAVVTLEGRGSPDLCAGLIALIERGAIAVPLAALPGAKRAEFLDIAEVETVLAVDNDGTRRCEHTGRLASHELYRRLRTTATPGLVLFSSGTSGTSKASVLDMDRALARYGAPRRPQRILSFLNLDHIGGINTLLHTLTQGGCVVMVGERTPERVLATIERHRVQVLPTTPTFLNLLLISGALARHRADSLDLITYGTEPMPLSTLSRLRAAVPGVRLKQTYGLSELGILPTRSRDDHTLWIKIGGSGFEHRIRDGVLWIRSDMAMLGYLNAPAPFDADGYFNTQDAVEVDGEWVHILGRRSEIINVGGEKVYPIEVENVLLEIPGVADAMVSGVPSHVTGTVVKAVVRLVDEEDARAAQKRIRRFCVERLEPFKVPAVVEVSTAEQHSDRFKKLRRAS